MKGDGIAPLGVPLWDQPFDGEHAPGLFLRLAEINGYPSTDDVARETRLTLQGLRLGRGVRRLAAIVCSDEGRLTRDGFAFARGDGVLVRGERIGRRRDLHRKLRRVCPACVTASRHQRFWFDLAFIETCPEHGCRLVGRCPCPAGRDLSWRDGRVGGCRACEDGDVAAQLPEPAEPAALAVDSYFLGRLGVVPRKPDSVLDPLGMADAIDVLERVGALSLGGYRSRWP
ncbi:TniQ family protein, partial [Streptomyces sp. NPDC014793]